MKLTVSLFCMSLAACTAQWGGWNDDWNNPGWDQSFPVFPNDGQDSYPNDGQGLYPNNGQDWYPNNGQDWYPNNGQDWYPNDGQDPYPNDGQDPYPNDGQDSYPDQNAGSAECGRTPIEPIGDVAGIIGGQISKPGSIPWQVGITRPAPNEHVFCGASIIGKNWILTAAHCVEGDMERYPGNFRIKVGAFDWKTSGENFAINQVYIHPKYQKGSKYVVPDDIALIRLSKAITYGDKVQPVCLPINDNAERKEGVKMTITGWGGTNIQETGGSANSKLKQVSMNQFDPTKCRSTVLCFPGAGSGTSAFHGDSGGPLVRRRGNTFYQFGLVSGGSTEEEEYTRVSQYCAWIKEKSNIACV